MSERVPAGARVSFCLEISFLMFLCSAAIALARTLRVGVHDWRELAVAVSAPALAWLIIAFLAWIVPPLVSPGRLTFPLNFTLPLVYSGLTYLVFSLVSRPSNGILAPNSALTPALLWGEPGAVFMALGAQIVTLSSCAAFVNAARRRSA